MQSVFSFSGTAGDIPPDLSMVRRAADLKTSALSAESQPLWENCRRRRGLNAHGLPDNNFNDIESLHTTAMTAAKRKEPIPITILT
jgi:hypothetical protein